MNATLRRSDRKNMNSGRAQRERDIILSQFYKILLKEMQLEVK